MKWTNKTISNKQLNKLIGADVSVDFYDIEPLIRIDMEIKQITASLSENHSKIIIYSKQDPDIIVYHGTIYPTYNRQKDITIILKIILDAIQKGKI